MLEPLRAALNAALGTAWEEWQIPREADSTAGPASGRQKSARHAGGQRASRGRRRSTPPSPRKADVEFLYDRPYEDKSRVRVAGPFTVESLSPHRVRAGRRGRADRPASTPPSAAPPRRRTSPSGFRRHGAGPPAAPPACTRGEGRHASTSPGCTPGRATISAPRAASWKARRERRAGDPDRPRVRHASRRTTSSPPPAKPPKPASTC